MYAAEAFRYFNIAPRFAAVSGYFYRADIVVSDPFLTWLGTAIKHREQPVTVIHHDNRLADKRARFIEQGSDLPPGFPQIPGLAIANDSRILIT